MANKIFDFSGLRDNLNRIKKPYLISGIFVISCLLYYLIKGVSGISGVSGKIDDWSYSYSPNSPETSFITVYIIMGVLIILAWLAIPVWLIVRGKSDDNGANAKRKLGIILLIIPPAVIMILFSFLSTGFWGGILAILAVTAILVILDIKNAIRGHMKIMLIHMALILFIILIISLISAFSFGLGASQMAPFEEGRIGLATGGAKDINNFRQNVKNNYLPLPTDITYEGLFYDYFFDTGETARCEKIFCPSYSFAVSRDPFSKKEEYYLQAGLNSNINESEFSRKNLNLVIVLDISGSMSSTFYSYYYDRYGKSNSMQEPDEDMGKTKMSIASIAVVNLLDHLKDDDRFGMVLYDHNAYLAKPLDDVGKTDMDAIKAHIMELTPMGGTQMSAGLIEATRLFERFRRADPEKYENRIIFLTDAMPNVGITSEEGLLSITEKNSKNNIYTTFIGIGVDFNTELVENLTKIRGANYYSVHSAKEFKTRMDDEFEYMVTPLVFDLSLTLDAPGFEIEKVYGSPEANEATGEIMKVNTLFPSKKEGTETKGGIVILKLNKLSGNASLTIKTSYEDRSGQVDGNEIAVAIPQVSPDYYDNDGIRKGIVLSRYVNVMKNWIVDERMSYHENRSVKPSITLKKGIAIPADGEILQLGRWERQSVPLRVTDEYKDIFREFKTYLETEKQQLHDENLSKEVKILEKLINLK